MAFYTRLSLSVFAFNQESFNDIKQATKRRQNSPCCWGDIEGLRLGYIP
jgi:hypothetical protein